MAACRHDLARHHAAALASDDPSGIHDVRVALRRLRAARAIDAEARDLADAFSPARDLQVLLFEMTPDTPADVARVARN